YLTTGLVVFVVAMINFIGRLKDVPEEVLAPGRSNSFNRYESIAKYVTAQNLAPLALVAALAMVMGLQESSLFFPVGGLDPYLQEPSLALSGEAQPLNGLAYTYRSAADTAFRGLEALVNLLLVLTVLPWAVLSGWLMSRPKPEDG
ncbi:MAG: hypothetical protein AAF633_18575, partial [Chloroflexota bacterium]